MTEEELFGLTDDEKRRHRFQRPVDPNALLRSDLRNIKIELGQIRDRIAILSQRLNDKAGQVDVVDDAHTGRLWLRRAIDDLEEAEEYVGCVIKKTQT